jgi:hypothetical protein
MFYFLVVLVHAYICMHGIYVFHYVLVLHFYVHFLIKENYNSIPLFLIML